MSNPQTTQILLERARDGDRDALDALFQRVYPDLVRAARRRMGDGLRSRMETRDLAQTAYFEAYRDLPRYTYRGKGSFFHWHLGILDNKIHRRAEYFRAQKRDSSREVPLELSASPDAKDVAPEEQLVQDENRERLLEAVESLPGAYREVVGLRYFLRLPWAEIASHFGKTEEACQMLCKRALGKLKTNFMAPSDFDDDRRSTPG
ncbi:MAG: sigma-70 family RNA polymerase sigma factor [Planctomycetota bacterium]